MDAVRERRGIIVAELARRAGIDGKRLWYVLRGNRTMRADELSDYAVLDLKIYFLTRAQQELRANKIRSGGEWQRASEVRNTLKGDLCER